MLRQLPPVLKARIVGARAGGGLKLAFAHDFLLQDAFGDLTQDQIDDVLHLEDLLAPEVLQVQTHVMRASYQVGDLESRARVGSQKSGALCLGCHFWVKFVKECRWLPEVELKREFVQGFLSLCFEFVSHEHAPLLVLVLLFDSLFLLVFLRGEKEACTISRRACH